MGCMASGNIKQGKSGGREGGDRRRDLEEIEDFFSLLKALKLCALDSTNTCFPSPLILCRAPRGKWGCQGIGSDLLVNPGARSSPGAGLCRLAAGCVDGLPGGGNRGVPSSACRSPRSLSSPHVCIYGFGREPWEWQFQLCHPLTLSHARESPATNRDRFLLPPGPEQCGGTGRCGGCAQPGGCDRSRDRARWHQWHR